MHLPLNTAELDSLDNQILEHTGVEQLPSQEYRSHDNAVGECHLQS